MKALITGITGQTGSYLAEILLSNNYEVYGLVRNIKNTANIKHITDRIKLYEGDIINSNLSRLFNEIKPDEIYNLAGYASVTPVFAMDEYHIQVNSLAPLRIFESLKCTNNLGCKVFQAGSSEMFGFSNQYPQTETASFCPVSKYGIAKLNAYWTTKSYRDEGFYAVNGILYNHESYRRSENYVTKKVIKEAIKILIGIKPYMFIGNLEAKRDWSHASDIARGIFLSMNEEKSDDYIFSSGAVTTVREFITLVFKNLKTNIEWINKDFEEVAIIADSKYRIKKGQVVVKIDKDIYREDKYLLKGDPKKALSMGWKPKYDLEDIIKEIIDHELK